MSNLTKITCSPIARSAILVAADSPARIRSGDAWRVYDKALELGCLREVKTILQTHNPKAYEAMLTYEGEEGTR